MGNRYRSETDKYRSVMEKFCVGAGIDVGYGGDPVVSSAITIDNPDGLMANCGDHPLNLPGDARKLKWFRDLSLDYVYSSHCLEDFENTKEILIEWARVLKLGGKLVLLLPDQRRYERHCIEINEQPNASHKIKEFGLAYLKSIVKTIPNLSVIYENDLEDDYNFQIVIEKIGLDNIKYSSQSELDEKSEFFQQELLKSKKECEQLKYEIEEVKRSKFWALRSFYMRLKGEKG